jgi:hypothetical protein
MSVLEFSGVAVSWTTFPSDKINTFTPRSLASKWSHSDFSSSVESGRNGGLSRTNGGVKIEITTPPLFF